jgi:antitoxin VapB
MESDVPAPKRDQGVMDTARIFAHGGSQAVRLPKAYRFSGKAVLIHREGERVILEPMTEDRVSPAELKAMWARIDRLSDPDHPFPDPPEQEIASPPAKL